MGMGQGVVTGVGHGGIICVLQLQFSSFICFYVKRHVVTLHYNCFIVKLFFYRVKACFAEK